MGKCFIQGIICDKISKDLEDLFEFSSLEEIFKPSNFGVLRIKGGGGRIFLGNRETKKCYGKVPLLPYDVHKYSKEFKSMITKYIL